MLASAFYHFIINRPRSNWQSSHHPCDQWTTLSSSCTTSSLPFRFHPSTVCFPTNLPLPSPPVLAVHLTLCSLPICICLCFCQLDTHLEGSCKPWQGASRSAGYSWGSGQRWRCHWDTLQILLLRCNTAAHHGLEENTEQPSQIKLIYVSCSICVLQVCQYRSTLMTWALPICLRVSSTDALRLTFDNRPRQKRSELEGSVKPSTVSEGCEAWKVSPTRWLSS